MRDRSVLFVTSLSSAKMHFSEVCLAREWTVTEHTQHSPLGWVACGSGVRGLVAMGGDGRGSGIQSDNRHRSWAGSVVLLSSGTLRTLPAAQWKKYCGSVWNMISLLLTTDDVVKICTTACRWNVGDKYGLLGDTFFWLLKMEQFEKSWNCDEQGRRTYTMLRFGIRRFGLHPFQEETQTDDWPGGYDLLK